MILKPIPHHPGYFASSDGDIYCNLPIGLAKTSKLRKLKPSIQSSGKYYIVTVKDDNNIRKTKRIHRLVCSTFHGKSLNKSLTASHLDGNWKNNKAENLKWETMSQNHNRKKEHGTDDIGIKNSRAKINLKTLIKIRKLLKKQTLTHEKIGHLLKLNRGFISKIANGSRYKNQGNF